VVVFDRIGGLRGGGTSGSVGPHGAPVVVLGCIDGCCTCPLQVVPNSFMTQPLS
jgi:hypothetical protein